MAEGAETKKQESGWDVVEKRGEDGRWMTVFARFEAGFAIANNRQKMQMRIADTVGKGCAVVTAVSVWRWNGRRFKVSVEDRGVGRGRQDHLMEQGTGLGTWAIGRGLIVSSR